jgi:hypothetical protein
LSDIARRTPGHRRHDAALDQADPPPALADAPPEPPEAVTLFSGSGEVRLTPGSDVPDIRTWSSPPDQPPRRSPNYAALDSPSNYVPRPPEEVVQLEARSSFVTGGWPPFSMLRI